MDDRVETASDKSAIGFWDRLYADDPDRVRSPLDVLGKAVDAATAYFGDLRGKTLIDVGCGNGDSALAFAKHGANVIAVDNSKVGIEVLKKRCERLGVANVKPVVCDAMAIDTLGPCDLLFGAMILHHIEPFDQFCGVLQRTLGPGGKGFFWENNAASRILIWFRTHVVGRLWVPKYGDAQEFPLTPDEVAMLGKHLDVRVVFPYMMFFALVSDYILRGHFAGPFKSLDRWMFKHNLLVRHSYQQYLYLEKR